MAHTCPSCGMTCHCRGDIDDLVFGTDPRCECCDDFEDDWEDTWDDDEELNAAGKRQPVINMITDPREGQPEGQEPTQETQPETLPETEKGKEG